MKRILCLAPALFLTGVLHAVTVDEVIEKTGISGGFCAFPLADKTDAALLTELAKHPAFVVHAQSADTEVVAKLRDTAEAAGLLGRSLYVESGNPAQLPYADRFVDLLLADRLRDNDLTPEFRTAIVRVLAPGCGTALLGRAKQAGRGLSKKALQTWAQALPQATVIDDASGLWVLLRANLPAGSDEWSHRLHGAENSQVSSDTTIQPPFLVQWWGMPRQEGFWGTTVVAANGRMFTLRGSRNAGTRVSLTARSLHNGLVLWQRGIHPAPENDKVPHGGYVPGRSCLVAEGNEIFLIDSNSVLRLDAATGAERGRIAGPKPDGQIKWIACSDGLLAMMAGDVDRVVPIAYQTIADNPTGRVLSVYNLGKNKELWHAEAAGSIDERMLALRDKHLYAVEPGAGVVCRELHTGKVVWTNPDTEIQELFRTPETKVISQLLVSQPVLSALDDVLLLRAKWVTNTVVLSRNDGHTLWKGPADPGSYRALTALPVDGLFLGSKGAVTLTNGNKLAKSPNFTSSGCGPTTAVPGYLITCFGAVLDRTTGQRIRNEDIKSPCDVGSIIAEGLIVTVPSECGCGYEVKGYRALAAAGAFDPHAALSNANERVTLLDTKAPEAISSTDADWPTYRHDAQRSAASTATVGAPTNVLWHWKPAGAIAYTNFWPTTFGPRVSADFLPTAPVTAAGRVWFASVDGIVRCVEAATGKELWKFATGSMLFAPPTLWQGRVLIGGGDGRVYGLDASTGRALWQFQAAPIDRRVFWFGHLISTWPIISGVVVQDDVAHFVAGFQKDNGIHAYALDAKSGQVHWEKHDAGAMKNGGGYSSDGIAAAGVGRLWIPSMSYFPGAFDLQTGNYKPAGSGQFASEIGVFSNKWILQGGRRLSETQDTLKNPLGGCYLTACAADGTARVTINDQSTMLPAWDADMIVMPPKKGIRGPLTAEPVDKLLAWLTVRSAPQPKPDPNAPKPDPNAPKVQLPQWDESKLWATEALTPIAFALTKNQVVVTYEDGKRYSACGFNRADGTNVWSVDLPEQPVMRSLAIDRDGRVLISLCDGSIICLGP